MQPLAPTPSRSSSPIPSRFLRFGIGHCLVREKSSQSGWLIARLAGHAFDRWGCTSADTQSAPAEFLQIATGQWGAIDQATHFCVRSAAEYYLVDRQLNRDGSVSILNHETAQQIVSTADSYTLE